MEMKYEKPHYHTDRSPAGMLHRVSENLLANLPILVLGFVVTLAIAGDMF